MSFQERLEINTGDGNLVTAVRLPCRKLAASATKGAGATLPTQESRTALPAALQDMELSQLW